MSASPKPRYQWLQSATKLEISVYIKHAQQVQVTFQPDTLLVLAHDDTNQYKLDIQLAHAVNTSQCSYEVLKTKIEVILTKATEGQWTALEVSEDEGNIRSKLNSNPIGKNQNVQATSDETLAQRERKRKNWDSIVTELDEPEDNDTPDNVFSTIYKNATDEQKRAMIKSYQESMGTSLSTNWDEVKDKKTEIRPPDDMYVKKWN